MRSGRRGEIRTRPSVLDRLLDPRPDQLHDGPDALTQSLPALRQAVHRDLEALLNARCSWRTLDARRPDLRVSPLGYGLSDVTAGALNSPQHRERLRHEIELLIRRFEPRLSEVRVSLLKETGPLSATLPLAIDALLLIDPEPEPIRFGTAIDPMSANLVLQSLRNN